MSIAFPLSLYGYVNFHGVVVSFRLRWLVAAASFLSFSFLKSIVHPNSFIDEFY
jgi:hypothetical protein